MIGITDKNGQSLSSSEIITKIIIRINSYLLDFWLMILNFISVVPSDISKQPEVLFGFCVCFSHAAKQDNITRIMMANFFIIHFC